MIPIMANNLNDQPSTEAANPPAAPTEAVPAAPDPAAEAAKWEGRYLAEALRYARLLLSATERELDLYRERMARVIGE